MAAEMKDSSNEISIKDLLYRGEKVLMYLKTVWWKIFIVGFLGGVGGFLYASRQPIIYTAKTSFVVEEGKSGSSSLGGLASLVGQFGVDMGGDGAGGGLFTGDNILLYFKSPSLAREVLMSRYDTGSKQTVADVYSSVYNLNESWEKNEKIGKVNFYTTNLNESRTRLRDSLLKSIIDIIIREQFYVGKTDKKAGFIEVTANMQNETLAKLYCERIVERAVEKYIKIKTQRQKATVDKLQVRLDSIVSLLRQKTFSGASLQTSNSTMDINPLYKTGTSVALETTVRDKSMLATIFASVAQNLEIAKFTLSQETPVIQIVDNPVLPLTVKKSSKVTTGIIFSIISALILTLLLLGRKALIGILD